MFKIIIKNFKLLMRSKSSALIIIFGPLFLIFLVGLAFNNSEQYSVNIGVYSYSYSNLATSIVSGLEENKFRVTRYESETECVNSIKEGTQHTCIIFSQNFAVSEGMDNEINFSVDYSKVNLVWMILDTISSEVSSTSSSLTTDMTNILISKIEATKKEINEDSKIILELTSKNSALEKNREEILSQLKTMNHDMDINNFPLEGVVESSDFLAEYVGYMIMHTEDLISNVKGEVNSYKINASEKEGIYTVLAQTEVKMNNLKTRINSQSENLTLLAEEIASSVETVKSKMDSAGLAKTEAVKKLDEIKSLTDEVLANLIALKSSFDRIENDIASIQVFNAGDISTPIKTTIVPVNTESTHLNYMFPSLVILVIMFISILLSSTLVIMEKKSKAYFRNFITPTNDTVFVLATYFTSLIIVIFQLALLMVVSHFYFSIDLFSNIYVLVFVMFLVSSVFILVGMSIGYIFSNEEASTLASISIGSIFLFLSSVIIPIESMPEYILKLARFNPFVIGESLLKKVVLFNVDFFLLKNDLILLGGYIIGLFVFISIMQFLMKKVYLTGFKHVVRKVRKKKK